MLKVLGILNPRVGRMKESMIRREVSACGRKIDLRTSEKKGKNSVYELVRRFAKDYDAILVAGGDGSINKAIKALVFAKEDKPVLVMPVGSSNDVAHNLGLPKDIGKCLKLLRKGKMKQVDVGLVEAAGMEEVFVNVFSVGFIAEMAHTAERIKGNRPYIAGRTAYTIAFLRELPVKKFCKIKVEFLTNKGEYLVMEDDFLSVCAMNGKRAGAVFNIAPEAKMDDGLFDLFLSKDSGRWRALQQVAKVIKGEHKQLKEVIKLEGELPKIKRMEIFSTAPLKAQVDGEPIKPRRNFEISIIEKRIRFFVP